MNSRMLVLCLAFVCTVFYAGCASAPQAEIDATKAAIAAAQTDDIRTYAPESLKAAEDELGKAMAEVQGQDGKFGMSRDYKQASAQLKSAKDLAEKAKSDAQAAKIKAKADAEAIVAELPKAIGEAKTALAKAPRGKDTKADLEAMQNDLKVAEESLTAANTAMSQEKYKDALVSATSAKEKVTGIVEQVKKAQEKLKGRR